MQNKAKNWVTWCIRKNPQSKIIFQYQQYGCSAASRLKEKKAHSSCMILLVNQNKRRIGRTAPCVRPCIPGRHRGAAYNMYRKRGTYFLKNLLRLEEYGRYSYLTLQKFALQLELKKKIALKWRKRAADANRNSA
ncbi:MAG: hypothetical protein D3923_05690 [Candidatus Electrothrix sp. AR3]|nr:hypothetical protein [Candidatus Electrothrix sp. AR3]